MVASLVLSRNRFSFFRLRRQPKPIDGSELVETFLRVRRETGKPTWDVTQTQEFRAVFVRMLEKAQGAADPVALPAIG